MVTKQTNVLAAFYNIPFLLYNTVHNFALAKSVKKSIQFFLFFLFRQSSQQTFFRQIFHKSVSLFSVPFERRWQLVLVFVQLLGFLVNELRDPRREVEERDAEEEADVAADLGHQREERVQVVLLAQHHPGEERGRGKEKVD